MPGKFNSVNDEAIYAQTLDGFGETVGDVQTFGKVYTRITIEEAFDWEVPFTSITRVQAGTYIVEEDSQGFVTVRGYAHDCAPDMQDLEARWESILEEVAQFEEDEPCEWFVNQATVPAWCCGAHMYDGTGDFPATGEHPETCPFVEA